jgi:hypothetical protein
MSKQQPYKLLKDSIAFGNTVIHAGTFLSIDEIRRYWGIMQPGELLWQDWFEYIEEFEFTRSQVLYILARFRDHVLTKDSSLDVKDFLDSCPIIKPTPFTER